MPQSFSSFHQLLSSLESQQTPALVWYSVPGERIELSGRVLMNWVSKTSNLLDDELDFSDAPQASLLFSPHWRSIAIALAVLNAGGTLAFEQAPDSSVLFTDSAKEAEKWVADGNNEYVVAVDRGALAPRFTGATLASDVIDYCAEVRSFADAYFPLNQVSGDTLAWQGTSHSNALKQVQETAQEIAAVSNSAFIFPIQDQWTADYLLKLLGVFLSGKTAIILDPTISWDENRLDRIAHDEKAVIL